MFSSIGATVYAETINYSMYVNSADYSQSTGIAKKDDNDVAVTTVLSGLGGFWDKAVYFRVRSNYDGGAASYLIYANSSVRHNLPYLEGYGNYGSYYYLNASLYETSGSTTVSGRFSP